jgi:uncharacterized protein YndB with AHSA1/START domain
MSDVESGVIEVQNDRYTLTLVRHLSAKIQEVWAALTEPVDLEEWFAPTRLEPVEGGAIEIDFGGGDFVRGKVLCFEPPAVFEFTWSESAEQEPSIVRFELTEVDGGTVLHLTHHKQGAELARRTAAGWHAHMDLLDGALRGTPASWDECYPSARARYAPIVAAAFGDSA